MPSNDTHELFAVKVAVRVATRGVVFVGGDPHDAPITVDHYLWVARSNERTVVFSTGPALADADARNITMLRDPVDALGLIGVDAGEVTDVVLANLRHESTGNLGAFPAARFHVQDCEMAHVTGRAMTHRLLRRQVRAFDIAELLLLAHEERVVFHDGDAEPWPGIELVSLGGRTPGQMAARVATTAGPVVLAMGAAPFDESLLHERVAFEHDSVPATFEAYRRLRELAGDGDIVPGHDPAVLDRHHSPTGLEGVVVSLHANEVSPLNLRVVGAQR